VPEREIDPRRLAWLGPLTIMSSIGAVLLVRNVALRVVSRPPRFAPLGVGPPIVDTAVLVAAAVLVFAVVAGTSATPCRLYRRIAFVALAASFIPDVLLPGRMPGATWAIAAALMTMHVAAWGVTVTMLTTLTTTAVNGSGEEPS
jgi:hypothetical protein